MPYFPYFVRLRAALVPLLKLAGLGWDSVFLPEPQIYCSHQSAQRMKMDWSLLGLSYMGAHGHTSPKPSRVFGCLPKA